MKKVLACALTLALLVGCDGRVGLPYAREMGDTALLRTVGLDCAGEGVTLTVSTGRQTGTEGPLILSAVGDSLASAALAVQSQGDRYVYYGHVDQMLVGEEMAARGLGEVLDHLARESELGFGVQLWAVRGGTAGRVMRMAAGQGVPERLDQLDTDSRIGAAGITRTAAELMTVLARGGSTYLPALELAETREMNGEQENGQVLVPAGYAVVRQGRLVCWVDDEAARGAELMEERVFGHVVVLTLEDGAKVSLTVERAKTRCCPAVQDGELTGLDIVCELAARVVQTGRRLSEADLKRVQFHLERLEGERMVQAVELGQYWDADYLGLEQKVQMDGLVEKRAIKQQWHRVFRSLDIRVEVRGTVERSFGVIETAG